MQTAIVLSKQKKRLPALLTTTHNGAQGNITILKNTTVAVLRIKPVLDAVFEPNETITVTLAEGGNYSLGATLSLTDTIRNDDLPPVKR
jgi:hypothetical protein